MVLTHALEGDPDARLKVLLSYPTVTMVAEWVGNEFLGFRHKKRAEQIGVDILKRPPQPYIEEVRQVGVANVVVVGRISNINSGAIWRDCCCIELVSNAGATSSRKGWRM